MTLLVNQLRKFQEDIKLESQDPLSYEWAEVTKKYKVKARIGKGAYGLVIRARDRKTSENVAIK